MAVIREVSVKSDKFRVYSFGLALMLMLPTTALAQTGGSQQFPPPPFPPIGADQGPGSSQDSPQSEMEKKAMAEMAKRQNKQRQVELKRDTDQLLKLATQLKEYVDKTNENILSVDVINKADQIEKLAHSVKEKMKGP